MLHFYNTYKIPSHYYIAYVNGDWSGLTEKDQKCFDNFCDEIDKLMSGHAWIFAQQDNNEPEFYYHNDVNNFGADCFLIDVYTEIKPQYQVKRSAADESN